MFLSTNDVLFRGEVNDPWFSAHKFVSNFTDLNRPVEAGLYARDDAARVIGCLQKYQFCNPNLPNDARCTGLGGLDPSLEAANKLWQSDIQRLLFKWSTHQIFSEIGVFPSGLDDYSLLAHRRLSGLSSSAPRQPVGTRS
jgi:hypothetical protein